MPSNKEPTDERLAEVLASSRTKGLVAKGRALGVGVRTLVRKLTSAVWAASRRRLDAYLLSRAARVYEVLADHAEEGDYKAIQLFLKELEAEIRQYVPWMLWLAEQTPKKEEREDEYEPRWT